MGFETDQKAQVFACHPKHMMHEECYEQFKKAFANQRMLCPLCRKPIDESKMQKKKLIVEQDPAKPDVDEFGNETTKKDAPTIPEV